MVMVVNLLFSSAFNAGTSTVLIKLAARAAMVGKLCFIILLLGKCSCLSTRLFVNDADRLWCFCTSLDNGGKAQLSSASEISPDSHLSLCKIEQRKNHARHADRDS